MMNYNAVTPGWENFKHIWWIVAIALAVLTLLLWLLGFAGGSRCASPTNQVGNLVDNPAHLTRIATLEQENGRISGLQARITELESGVTSAVVTSDPDQLQRISTLETENQSIPGLQARISELESRLNSSSDTYSSTGLAEARVFFDSNSSRVPNAGRLYLSPVVNFMRQNPGSSVNLSGFHDPSGNPNSNTLLAYDRALAVRNTLVQAGIDVGRISIAPPTVTTGTGSPVEARRVEIKINN
ncbi:MAG: OmpA family protein [Gammaproteobacteria bacterium]